MDYNRVVSEAERRYGLPPGLLASVWQQESGGSTDLGLKGEQLSRGRGAAVGPFQIVPYYHPKADLGSFESQADYAAKYLKEVGVEGYYGTGQAPAGHPTTEQYKQQVMSRVQQQPPQAQPQGGSPMQGPPMIDPGFSLPSSQPLDLSPIEVDETPSFASAMASNPFLMMGLGILGTGDIGKGAMQGLLAASQAETNATKRNEFKIDQEYKRRQQQIWENQNRVAEQKMWGAGAMSPAERARNEQSMRTHERALTEQQQSRTTNPVMMQLADGTVAPVVYDKQTGTMRQVTESGMGEPVQVVGPAPKAGVGGVGGVGGAGGAGPKGDPNQELLRSMEETQMLYKTLQENPDYVGLPSVMYKTGSSAIGQAADTINGLFGTNLGGGETAAAIAAFQTQAKALTSENARDIINQGDSRMSDQDYKLAERLQSMNWTDPSAATKASLKALTELKWRRYLLNQGTPISQIYENGRPTLLGTPPAFRPKGSTPPEMRATPPQAQGSGRNNTGRRVYKFGEQRP